MDAHTLLLVNAVFNAFAALAWCLLAGLFRIAPTASWLMAAGHLSRLLALRCDACWVGWPDWWTNNVTQFAGLLTVTLLALAVRRMVRLRWRWADIAIVSLLGAVAIPLIGWTPLPHGPVIMVSASMALLSLIAARDVISGVGPGLPPATTAMMTLPYLALSLFSATRAALLVLTPDEGGLLMQERHSGVLLGWSWLVLSMAVSLSLATLLIWRLVARIGHLTRRDAMTGTLNRRAINNELQTLQALRARGHEHALVMVDIDHFKRINDELGHAAGDAALLHCVTVLRGCLRELDQLGRMGGEEFCVLLPHTGLREARIVAERMRRALASRPLQWREHSVSLTASFGVAAGQVDDALGEIGLAMADKQLYRAKAEGRNRVEAAEDLA